MATEIVKSVALCYFQGLYRTADEADTEEELKQFLLRYAEDDYEDNLENFPKDDEWFVFYAIMMNQSVRDSVDWTAIRDALIATVDSDEDD